MLGTWVTCSGLSTVAGILQGSREEGATPLCNHMDESHRTGLNERGQTQEYMLHNSIRTKFRTFADRSRSGIYLKGTDGNIHEGALRDGCRIVSSNTW